MKISFTILALSLLCCWVPGDATEHVLCPPINEVVTEGSPCQSECYGDEYCQADSGNNNTLCCPSSTCGQQCVTPLNVPYHTPALACPKVGDDVVGACWENCASCSDDELCCSNGCGHECKTAVQVTPICQGITDSHNGTSRPGEYIPQCSEDGTFSPVQCHGSSGYCWCVRPDTGEPVGKSMTRFQRPECNNCSHNGQVYYPADSFSDDCNTCLCFEDGSVSCTEIGCNAGCTHNGQVYYPGDSFSDDCNTCLCSEDGSVSCTEMDCNHGLVSPYHSCPVLEDGMAGICSEECSSDDDCNNDQKCCSNGCGHTCMDPIPIPFIAPPRKCPDTEDNECDVPECTDSCENSKLCCENGCNSLVCVDGILPLYPCTTTVNNLMGGELLGRFVPQCNEENGNFRALQCSSHHCWCVDTASGEPTSDMRESGSVGELECSNAGCTRNGQVYYPGDSFSDDCNTCLCSENGSVSCTEMDCNHGLVSPYHSCPVLEDDMAGICSEECSSDDDCNNDQKCCSNGCGHTCMDPIPIPFIAPPRKCPDTEDNECDVPECTDSCENSKLCCENGCNSLVCVDGILPLYPCTTTVNNLTGGELLGRFVPQCNEENGNFRALQCSSHYCWCVDTASGEPTSDMRESGSVGELECSSCEYKGKMYDHGTVVEVYEECSKSTCLAGELVRSQGCDQCEYNGKMYEHGEHTDRCGYCTCLDGGIACADSVTLCSDHCIHKGLYHIPGDVFPEGDGCNTCFCSNDFEVTCTEVDCDGEGEDSDELAWWHSVMIGAGSLIAVLAVITIGLLVVMVMMIRSSQFRHKRLQETSETLSFEHDTEVLFKNGPPEAESVELKVPVEDDADPVNT